MTDDKEFLLAKQVSEADAAELANSRKYKRSIRSLRAQTDKQWHHSRTFDEELVRFFDFAPEWAAEGVILFNNPTYMNHQYLKKIRHQSSSICGGHAAVQMIHYMEDIRGDGQSDVGSIDITNSIHSTIVGDELVAYLRGGRPIKANLFLCRLAYISPSQLDKYSFIHSQDDPIGAKEINDALCLKFMSILQTKPMMLTDFKLEPSFLFDSAKRIFHIAPDFIDTPSHAMVIVGCRVGHVMGGRHGQEDYLFLCQNWQTDKQFVEVSAGYLAASESTFYVVPDSVRLHVSPSAPKVFHDAIETSVVDMAEEDLEKKVLGAIDEL